MGNALINGNLPHVAAGYQRQGILHMGPLAPARLSTTVSMAAAQAANPEPDEPPGVAAALRHMAPLKAKLDAFRAEAKWDIIIVCAAIVLLSYDRFLACISLACTAFTIMYKFLKHFYSDKR
jgi:hypothetical protein